MNTAVFIFIILVVNKVFGSNTTEIPADLSCEKITAYYDGTFQYPKDRSNSFSANVQVKFGINLKDEKIYFEFDHWNKTLTDEYGFSIDHDLGLVHCNTTQKEACSATFKNSSYLYVDFKPYSYSGYTPKLIRIYSPINNTLTLVDAIGNCATSLQNNDPDSDSLLYKSCFCCGDEYNPDPSLGCPVSPWS